MRLSRRAVIVGGGAATALPRVSFAGPDGPTVEWVFDREDKRWGLTIGYLGARWRLRLRDFGREAAFEVADASEVGIRIGVVGCRFPGRAPRPYDVRFDLTRVGTDWRLRMMPGAWLPGWAEKAVVVPLQAFMHGGAAATFGLSRSQGGTVCRQLFGNRMEVGSAIEARFLAAGGWSLRSADGSIIGLKDAARIEALTLSIARAGDGHGASLQARAGDVTSDALVAVARLHGEARPIPMGAAPGEPRIELRPRDSTRARVAFRQWGDETATAAFMRAAFEVRVSDEGVPTSSFEVADGLFVRRDVTPAPAKRRIPSRHEREEPVLDRFDGVVAPDDASVATAYGPFVVRGDDLGTEGARRDASSAADVAAALPASGTRATIECRGDRLAAFEIRALLTNYALALPDDGSPPRSTGGSTGALWSRLDFAGTEVAFVIGQTEGARASGRNARGVVEIGRRPEPALPWPDADLAEGEAPVEIALEGCALKVRRPADLLALDFRFRGLNLQVGPRGARVAPSRRRGVGGAGRGAANEHGQGPTYDDRALLVVEFPPQHVAETAFLRQVEGGRPLPEPPLGADGLDAVASRVRSGGLAARKANRSAERDNLIAEAGKTAPGSRERAAFDAFLGVQRLLSKGGDVDRGDAWPDAVDAGPARDALLARWEALPVDQRIYLGTDPSVADLDARAVILAIWRSARATELRGADAKVDELVAQLPDVVLDPATERSIVLRLGADPSGRSSPAPGDPAATERPEVIAAIEAAKEARDREYRHAREAWRSCLPASGLGGKPAFAQYRGRARVLALHEADASARPDLVKLLQAVANGLAEDAREAEGFPPVTKARLSGPTRLAFRIDGAFTSLVDPDRPGPGWIPFSLNGLTRWGGFDLAVIRRAERYYKDAGGRLPIPSLRLAGGDANEILAHQGIRPGQAIDGRLADVRAAASTWPDAFETAIELPFRLTLSPSQEGRFRTPQPVPEEVFCPPGPSRIRTPLWTAALEPRMGSPDVRAIASADFRPAAFDPGGSGPDRGPSAPWSREAHVADPKLAPERFRTALDALDRHELVGLTSTYGLPVLGRYDANGQITDGSQFAPPPGYRLRGLSDLPGFGDQSAIYRPKPLAVSELRLSALGGSLNVLTDFVPPAAALDGGNRPLFPAFTIARWRQRTVLGRDVEVEVVYKGYLYPLGFKASLVKLTERRFALNEANGRYTAFLVQRLFIRVGERDKAFPALGQPDAGRRFPARTVTMVTTQTPDILDPNGEPPAGGREVEERASGTLVVPAAEGRTRASGLAFWPRTSPGPGGNVGFSFQIESNADAATLPLIFVDNAAANDSDVLEKLADHYNRVAATGLRTVQLGGTQRRYAEERKAGEASNETFSWELRVEGRKGVRVGTVPQGPADPRQNESYASDALLQGADQPPFYPFVNAADIRVGVAERFVGRPLPRRQVEFHPPYVLNGFPTGGQDPSGEVYLRLRDEPLKLDMGQAGDQGGGLGRIAQDVRWLGRDGPIGYSVPPPGGAPAQIPEAPPVGLRDFFNGDAKLLGIISFGEVLELASTSLPRMTEVVESATEDTVDLLRQTVVPQLRKALDVLDAAWDRAGSALKQGTGVGGPATSLDIDKVYPEVGPSLGQLRRALDRVAAAEGVAVIASLNEVQESARRFAQAIERTAQDPIAPLREEVRARFRAFSHGIEEYAGVLSGQLLAALAVARDGARVALRTTLVTAIAAAPRSARDLLLVLPVPAGATVPDPDLAEELDDAAKAGLSAFVNALPVDRRIGDVEIRAGLAAARDAARARLQALGDAALGPYVDELEETRDDVHRLRGLLFDRLFGPGGWVVQVQDAEEALAVAVRGAGRDLLERLGAPVRAMLRAFLDLEAARRLAASAANFCDEGAKQVAAFVDQALPRADALSGVRGAVVSYGTALELPPEEVTRIGDRVAAEVARYRSARGRIGGAAHLSGLCKGAADFPAPDLARLLAARRSLLFEMQGLLGRGIAVTKPDDARAPLSQVLDQVTLVLGTVAAFDASGGPLKALDDLFARVDTAEPRGLLDDIVHERIAALRAKGTDALGAPAKALDEAVAAARADLADATKEVEAIRASLQARITAGVVERLVGAEDALASLAGELAASASPIGDVVSKALADAVRASFEPVAVVHGKLKAARHEAYLQLRSASSEDGSVGLLGLLVRKVLGRAQGHLADVLLVAAKTGGDDANDRLSDEDALIRLAATGGDEAALVAASSLADAWRTRDPAVVLLGRQIGDVLTAVLRGDLAQFVDLQAIRAEVEAAVRQMLPTRIRRSYDFDMGLGGPEDLKKLIEFDGDEPRLKLTATGAVDLLRPTAPTFAARGALPGFTLHLLPKFEVVHLKFAESVFASESGKPSSLSLRVVEVVLGEKVKFLQELQAYLAAPKDGSGFFVLLGTGRGRPGITAGYKLALSPISLGDLYISNISLGVAAELPFDDGDARFTISLGRPDAPLVISAFPYAGAGYFGLVANPRGIVGFEASFEFGGGGGFSFGPLTGEGRVTVGIFVRQVSGYTELYGMFFAGGSARIACFSMSTSLLVRMSQNGSDLVGQAVYTFSFSIGITDFHYAVTVSKRQSGSKSGGGTSARLDGRTRLAALGVGDAESLPCASPPRSVAKLSSTARCKGEDWAEHRRYFDPTFHATLF